MTDENRRRNLQAEVARGDASLRAADALFGLDLRSDSVSRAYYAAYHLVTALLFSAGLEARTHAGTHDLFYQHFVRPGIVAGHLGKWFSGLQKYREIADYSRTFDFTEDGAREELDHARELCRVIRERLDADGWLGPA